MHEYMEENNFTAAAAYALPQIHIEALHSVQHETNAPLRFMSFDIECLPDQGEMPKAEKSPVSPPPPPW